MTTSIPIELHPVEDVSAQSAYDAVISSREALAPWMHWLTPSYSLRDQQAFQSRSAVLRGAGLELQLRCNYFRGGAGAAIIFARGEGWGCNYFCAESALG